MRIRQDLLVWGFAWGVILAVAALCIVIMICAGCGSLPELPPIGDVPLPPVVVDEPDIEPPVIVEPLPDPPSAGAWRGDSQAFELPGKLAGEVSFTTRGIVHRNGNNADGGAEYIFLQLSGRGFERVLLMNMAGNRGIRYLITAYQGAFNLNAHSNDLPGEHQWRVQWGGGYMTFRLDDNVIGREPFTGVPTGAIIGGNGDPRRNFKGEWRGFSQ